jgi:hypothetical protein
MGRGNAKRKRRLTSRPPRPIPSRIDRLRAFVRRNLGLVVLAIGIAGAIVWRILHWLGYIHSHHPRH